MPHELRQSYVQWMVTSLGPYVLYLPVAGLLCFVLTLIAVLRGKGSMAAVALVLIVPIPIFIGAFGCFQGAISFFRIIATSEVAPKPREVADAVSVALFAPFVGLMVMVPSYAVAVFGALYRSLSADPERLQERPK